MWLNFLQKLTIGRPTVLTETTGIEEPSLLEEWWNAIVEKYFTVQSGQYEHIDLGTSSLISMQTIIFGIAIGIVIAAGVACYDKNRLGAFVRKIVKSQCLWPEKAMTLEELGFERNSGVRHSLRSRNHLGRIVHCVEKEKYEAEVEAARAAYAEKHGDDKDFFMPAYRINFETDHFYIPDEEHYRAEIRYENKGSGWRAFVMVVILAIVGASVMCILLPDMLQLVDNMIGILSEKDNVLQ